MKVCLRTIVLTSFIFIGIALVNLFWSRLNIHSTIASDFVYPEAKRRHKETSIINSPAASKSPSSESDPSKDPELKAADLPLEKYVKLASTEEAAHMRLEDEKDHNETSISSTASSTIPHSEVDPIKDQKFEFARRPKIMIAGGCVGSTAAMSFILKLMKAHGIIPFPMGYESMKPEKNRWYDSAKQKLLAANRTADFEDVILEALSQMNDLARSKNQTLIFKCQLSLFRNNARIREGLTNMGFLFTAIYRENSLDSSVCTVRDCFAPEFGYPVIASNGTRADLCFKRRAQKDIQIKAFMEKPYRCVRKEVNRAAKIESVVGDFVFPSQVTSTESLFEFQYTSDERVLNKSKIAWTTLLKSFLGDRMDDNKILGILREHQNSRRPPGPHESVIYNIDSVMKELKAAEGGFENCFRLPSASTV
jgi:hypothetical protein